MVGAGKAEGAMDAGNMLKPALARGELHCVGATTLDEYRKYIEKDAALERRFQKVLVDEPSVEDTIAILRGLKERYEVHHGVEITDPAIVAAATLSHRYISDRQLPDKAIDLIDEAAARIRMEIDSKPESMDRLDRRLIQLRIEREAVRKEKDESSRKRFSLIEQEINHLQRFRRISVVIVDLSMPAMDGIAFCAGISDPEVKKVLMSGAREQKLALDAFNEGVIDRYIPKNTPTTLDMVVDYAVELQREYFLDQQRAIQESLSLNPPPLLEDPVVSGHFAMLRKKHRFLEHYLVGDPPGFVFLTAKGALFRLIVLSDAEVAEQVAYAARHNAPAEVVEALVEELRHHRGGSVERVRRLSPPRRPERPLVHPLLGGHPVPAALDVLGLEVLDQRRAADLLEVVEEDGHWLEPVPVAVDDRMVELAAHLRGLGVLHISHDSPPRAWRDRARGGGVSSRERACIVLPLCESWSRCSSWPSPSPLTPRRSIPRPSPPVEATFTTAPPEK
jgi:CheY-like chemotaxis protein